MNGSDSMMDSVVVHSINNGFLVVPSYGGSINTETVYCKTAEEIGNAVMSQFAKEKLRSHGSGQIDMFDGNAAIDLNK